MIRAMARRRKRAISIGGMKRIHAAARHTSPVYRRLPPLHTLQAFEAAARLGAFSRAGDALGLTQSAISHRIKLLEDALGVALFVRLPRSVTPTPQGELFRAAVEEALARLQRAAGTLPPLHALTAFEAIARHGHFARAAAELFLTASAVSHRIRSLEAQLGMRLLDRDSHGVRVNENGARLLLEVRAALAALQAGAARIGIESRPVLRLSVLPAFASGWLVQRLGSFYRAFPDIELEIASTSQLVNVKAGECDAAIRYGAGQWPGLAADRLCNDVVFPAASPEYLASIPAIEKPGDLAGAVFLRHRLLPWRRWFAAAGLDRPEPDTGPLFSDAGLMLDAAVSGHGIALARGLLAKPHLESGRLVALTRVRCDSEWNFHLVYRPEDVARPELAAFRDWLLAEFAIEKKIGSPQAPDVAAAEA